MGAVAGPMSRSAIARDAVREALRGVRMAVCIAGAVVLQVAGWQLAQSEIRREGPGASPRRTTPIRLATRARSGPVVGPRAAAAVARPAVPSAVHVDESDTDRPASGPDTPARRPFYDHHEVDIPAEPVEDWNLEPAALDRLAIARIVFTIFVGSDGRALHCSVDAPEQLAADVRRELAQRLCETELRPARRGGVAVASRRRIELFTGEHG